MAVSAPYVVLPVATPTSTPAVATVSSDGSAATRPIISLTSARTGSSSASHEWNPSANGSIRGARADSASPAVSLAAATPYVTSGSIGGYFNPSAGSSGSGSEAVSSTTASPVADSGESPLLANLLAGRSAADRIIADPGSASSSGSAAGTDLAGSGPVDQQSSAPFTSAVPEPAAFFSTLVGLGIAAFGARKSRFRAANRRQAAPPIRIAP